MCKTEISENSATRLRQITPQVSNIAEYQATLRTLAGCSVIAGHRGQEKSEH